jgi:hypothetical protein
MARTKERSTIQKILDAARVVDYLEENRSVLGPMTHGQDPYQAVVDALNHRIDALQVQRDLEIVVSEV